MNLHDNVDTCMFASVHMDTIILSIWAGNIVEFRIDGCSFDTHRRLQPVTPRPHGHRKILSLFFSQRNLPHFRLTRSTKSAAVSVPASGMYHVSQMRIWFREDGEEQGGSRHTQNEVIREGGG
jgi:hypothetical protein